MQGVSPTLFQPEHSKTLNMVVLANYHINVGCSYHRVYLPMQFWRDYEEGYGNVGLINESQQFPSYMNPDTILFFNRVPTIPEDRVLELKNRFGIKIVVDIDDHWILYPHHEMAEAWRRSKANEQIARWIAVADMVFVTNERLKVAASNLNGNVHVIPNTLPFGYYQFTAGTMERSIFDVIYAGGSSHLYDLSEISGAMKRLGSSSKFRNNARMVLAGYDRQYGVGQVTSVWDKMLNIVKKAGSYAVAPVQPILSYMDVYNGRSLSLAPLQRNNFNACKSNLKILEAGAKRIPIIASYVEPYVQDIGEPGVILCDTQKEWYDAIMELVENPDRATRLGIGLGEYVRKNYNMIPWVKRRVELFKQLAYGT